MSVVIQDKVFCTIGDVRHYLKNAVLPNEISSIEPVRQVLCSDEKVERHSCVLIRRFEGLKVILKFTKQVCWRKEIKKLEVNGHTMLFNKLDLLKQLLVSADRRGNPAPGAVFTSL